MFDAPNLVEAIHRDRLERLRRIRNPRRGWRDDHERTPRWRPRSERER
jgi:hypothetical protein